MLNRLLRETAHHGARAKVTGARVAPSFRRTVGLALVAATLSLQNEGGVQAQGFGGIGGIGNPSRDQPVRGIFGNITESLPGTEAGAGKPDAEPRERETSKDETSARLSSSPVESLVAIPSALLDARAILSSELSPDAVAARIGPDPRKLAGWVSERIGLLPYRGILKGPEGVLAVRAGNSLDRSLLLVALLEARGIETRLIRHALPDATARQLLSEVGRGQGLPVPDDVADLLAPPPDTAQPAKPRRRAQGEHGSGDLLERGQAIMEDVGPRLLQAASQASDGAAPSASHEALAALSDEWSVEAKLNQRWQALPTHGVDTSAAPRRIVDLDVLPSALRHRVRIRLAVTFAGQAPRELLTHTWDAASLSKSPAGIMIMPAERGEGTLVSGDANPVQRSLQTMAQFVQSGVQADELPVDGVAWLPMVVTGDRRVASGEAFTVTGAILNAEQLKVDGNAVGRTVNDATNFLQRLPRVNQPPSSAKDFTLSLEIDLLRPGEGGRVVTTTRRRLLAFAAGDEARASDGTMPERLVRQLLATHVIAGQSGQLTDAARLDKVIEAVVAAMRRRQSALTDEIQELGGPLPFALDFLAFEENRWNLSPDADMFFMDRPAVQMISLVMGRAFATTVFDIVENRIALLPRTATDPFEARVLQGLADTVAETMRALARGLESENSALLAQRNLAGGTGSTRVSVPTGVVAFALGSDADRRVLLSVDGSASGSSLWVLDPATGTVVGIDEFGRGADLAEQITVKRITLAATAVGAAGLIATNGPWVFGTLMKVVCLMLSDLESLQCTEVTDPVYKHTIRTGPDLQRTFLDYQEFLEKLKEATSQIFPPDDGRPAGPAGPSFPRPGHNFPLPGEVGPPPPGADRSPRWPAGAEPRGTPSITPGSAGLPPRPEEREPSDIRVLR